MSERVKTKAIILSSVRYGESSKMLTALSDKFGKISISAKGACKQSGPFIAVSQLFCYSDMELSIGKNGIYTLCEAQLIDSFYHLSEDLDVMMLANDVIKTVRSVSTEELADEDLMRLTLNTVYYLSQLGKRSSQESEEYMKERLTLVKAVFYIRLCCDQGVLAIDGDEERSYKCEDTFRALSYIVSTEFKTLFAFKVSNECLCELSEIAEDSLKSLFD